MEKYIRMELFRGRSCSERGKDQSAEDETQMKSMMQKGNM